MRLKRIYKPYTLWEDYLNGMYDYSKSDNDSILIEKACKLLSNETLFFNTCLNVLDNWKISSDVNLSNVSQNRKAWLGQAACCFKYKVPEILTRFAWSEINEEQRIKANNVAQKIISIYEAKNRRIHTAMGKQLLLEWDT